MDDDTDAAGDEHQGELDVEFGEHHFPPGASVGPLSFWMTFSCSCTFLSRCSLSLKLTRQVINKPKESKANKPTAQERSALLLLLGASGGVEDEPKRKRSFAIGKLLCGRR